MVASPKFLSELDLGIFDKLDSITSSISTLGEKMDELEAGTKDLANGTNALLTNSSVFNEKLSTAASSLEKIANGTVKLVDGVDEMLTTLTDAKTMMEDKDIDGSLANLKVLQAKNEATITKLTNPRVEAAYKVKKMSPTETETEMIARIKKFNPNLTVAEEQELKNVKSTYELKLLLVANNDAVKEMITNLEDLNTLLDTLTTKLEEVKEMQEKVTLLNTSLNELSVGLNKLAQVSTQINKGVSSLNTGATKISLGTKALNEQGIKTIVNYSNRIVTYSNKFESIVNLSKSYKGFASNNADNTLFVYKLSK